jgi:hypothetical protein
MNRSKSVGFSAKNRETLKSWLTSRCQYSDNVFYDPGYSSYYMSYFSHFFDDDDSTYTDDDIDQILNIGYFETVYDDCLPENEEDEQIRPYIDFVPSKIPRNKIDSIVATYAKEDQRRAREVCSRTGIVILPGSNQSNANFIYKRIMDVINNVRKFSVPYVGDRHKRFRPSYKRVGIELTKENIYNFVYSVSTVDHRSARMMSLLNIDQVIQDKFGEYSHGEWGDTNFDLTTKLQEQTERQKSKPLGAKVISELNQIDQTMDNLMNEIERYFGVAHFIWDNVLVTFMNSDDCNIFQYISDDDFWIFEKYMESRPIYSIMMASVERLRMREAFLLGRIR